MNLFAGKEGKKLSNALTYKLPQPLRIQIVQIWEKGFGPDERWHPGPGMAYERIHQTLCEEHKMFSLPQVSPHQLPLRGVIAEYFLNLTELQKALEVVQIVFGTMEDMVPRTRTAWGDDAFGLNQFRPAEIIEELNRRFRENKVGYQYSQGRIEKILQGPAPMPLKERLIAGEPARNLRKIKDMVGDATVTAIHDPYTTTGSLDTILKLADMGAKLSPSLRILGTEKPLSKSTEKKSFLGLLNDINTERKASWEVRIYPATLKPHRRFLILHDGSIVTCGMSLNHIDTMPNKPKITHASSRACYIPAQDRIEMPSPESFDKPENYYSVLFHELCHATANEKRLNRKGTNGNAGEWSAFGSNSYAREELLAEMGASFLCGEAGIVDRTIDNSAAYINSWLKRLNEDSKLVVQAASQAQKAADYILNRLPAERAAELPLAA